MLSHHTGCLSGLRGAVLAAAAVVAVLAAPAPSLAQDLGSFDDITTDLQLISQDLDKADVVWWMPAHYWDVMLGLDETVSDADREGIVSAVEPYTLFGVVSGDIGLLGDITFRDEAWVRANVTATMDDGRVYRPVDPATLSPDLAELVAAMGPILAGMVGPMGENMHFVAFVDDTTGGAIAQPLSEGSMTVTVGDEAFRYRLPLGSFLPARYDPETGERFPGNYVYSPFTGKELETR